MKIKFLYLFLSTCFLFACGEKIELSGGSPEFEVQVDKEVVNVGEEVVFRFAGKAGILSFFSGEIGHDYDFRDGRIVEAGDVSMSFRMAQVIASGTQTSQFSVHLSTDFEGIYDFSNVQSATWQNITDRFTLPSGSAYTESGTVDITDLVPQEIKPIYIGLRYITWPQAVHGTARDWFMQNFLLSSETSIGNLTLADMNNAGFQLIDEQARGLAGGSLIEASRLRFRGHEFDPDNDPRSENWIITKPIYAGTIDMGPDRPIAIKGSYHDWPSEYRYVYEEPGEYAVYFVAANANVNESREVVKRVDITVVESP